VQCGVVWYSVEERSVAKGGRDVIG
jgi:hypothetical protein